MSKKGFTLIEVLVVIVLLSLISLIVVPKMITVNDRIKGRSDKAKMSLVLSSASSFLRDNKSNLFDNNECVIITVEDLIESDYYEDDKELKDRKIVLIKDNKVISYNDKYKGCEVYKKTS